MGTSQADLEEIKAMIYSTGFYNLKAERIKRVSQIFVHKFDEKVPNNIEKLLELPGGRKEDRKLCFSVRF